jgi:hypothetical protein
MPAETGSMTEPVVVAVCGDAGGANAVAPVLEALRADGRLAVEALAYGQAESLWAKRALSFTALSPETTPSDISALLRRPDVVLLITGTSANGVDLEKRFIAAARDCGLPSLAVLDFWSNYRARFSDGDTLLRCVPDRIAVMDAWARDEMIAVGFDSSRLIVTGQPAFDDIATWRSGFAPARRAGIRASLGVGPSGLLVVFASQPLSRLYGTERTSPRHPGYDEHLVLGAVTHALDRIASRAARDVVLAIRPHPSESPDAFASVRSESVRTIVSREGEARDLIISADLVVGMTTALLVEACYLGCVTVSLQPDLRQPDVLPTNRLGLSRGVYRYDEIEPVLEQMLLDNDTRAACKVRLADFQPDPHATDRAVALVHQMARRRPQ